MSWKFIFNTTVSENKWWGNIDKANKMAKECGYKFFNWNGSIYMVDGGRTDIKIEDCF